MDNIKKFEDFLGRMQGLLDEAKRQGHIIIRVEDLEKAFPELAESEDERIRNNCIHFLNMQKKHHASTMEIDECIDWLDEQGKQFIYVVTRSEEHSDYVEKVFFDKERAEAYCKQFNEDEDSYHRDITKVKTE